MVAYFTRGKPVQGSDKYESVYGGVTWRFANKEHGEIFAASPEKYALIFGKK